MKPDLPLLYYRMARMRHFEVAMAHLWRRGLISGELHLGTGEEGIVAGVVAHLGDGDALALDYRSTPPLVWRPLRESSAPRLRWPAVLRSRRSISGRGRLPWPFLAKAP